METGKSQVLTISFEIFIAVVAIYIAFLQYKESKAQTRLSEIQKRIAESIEAMTETQESMGLLMFAREYLNGYVYQYDEADSACLEFKLIRVRQAGLPALAVPSQYKHGQWLIISPKLGDFATEESAYPEYDHWVNRQSNELSKQIIFDIARDSLHYTSNTIRRVFYYKADLVNNRGYFEKLIKSKDFIHLAK